MQASAQTSFEVTCQQSWDQVHQLLFNGYVLLEKLWVDVSEIANVLNLISQVSYSHHLYTPQRHMGRFKRSDS